MATYEALRQAIDTLIKANGNKEITGDILNNVLNTMLTALSANYQFCGEAKPNTAPGQPLQNVFYFAYEAGTYVNFGGITLPLGISMLKWDGTAWTGENIYTFDAQPLLNSSNLISSGAVFNALIELSDAMHSGKVFAGIADPSTTPDGLTNGQPIFYLAVEKGTYSHFFANGDIPLVLEKDGIWILSSGTDDDDWNDVCLIEIDDTPNPLSNELISSKAVYNAIRLFGESFGFGKLYNGIATPTTAPDPLQGRRMFYLATQEGTYEHFFANGDIPLVLPHDGLYAIYSVTGSDDDDWRWEQILQFDDEVISNSHNLPTSMAVYNTLEAFKAEVNALIQEINPTVIEGNVTNAPDEEDLTSVNERLKFKNKEYNSLSASGLGRVYLRKNWVNGVNTLTHAMINEENTIYIIQYDYVLTDSLVIPYNCILQFAGGTLINGTSNEYVTITGDNTLILGAGFKILQGVVLLGDWKNFTSNLIWWGCIPYDENNEIDNTPNIKLAVQSTIMTIEVDNVYGMSSPVSFSGRRLVGNSLTGRYCGFRANSNFHPISINITYKGSTASYTINSMFYYHSNQGQYFSRLKINGNYNVDYCFQHIVGYPNSNITFDDCYVMRARFACIFQSASEQCIMNHVSCVESNIGFLLSEVRPVAGDFCIPTGGKIGSMNLLQLNECFAGDCNHGYVIAGGSNTALINCKSAHNSRIGVITSYTNVTLYNFYSERDGMCNFWINPDTGEISSVGEDYVCPALLADADRTIGGVSVTDRLDGFKATTSLYGDVYYRSPFYFDRSNITIINPFMSEIHRGGRNQNIIKPTATETTYGGIDAYILTTESSINIDNPYLYNFSTDTNKYPWKYIIELMNKRFSDIMGTSQWNLTMYRKYPSVFVTGLSNINAFATTNKNEQNLKMNTNYGLINNIKEDYNKDIHLRKIGIGTNTTVRRLIYFSQLPVVDTYNGVPLSIRDYDNCQFLGSIVFTREEWLAKFNTNRIDSIKVRALFKVLNQYSGNNGAIYFSLYFGTERLSQDYMYIGRASSGRFACPTKGSIGVIEEILPVLPIIPDGAADNWQYAVLQLNVVSPNVDDLAVSDIFIYDVEDKDVAFPSYNSYFLEAGLTAERPVNINLPVGFCFFDKELNIPIFAKSIDTTTGIAVWVKATGATV